MEGLILAAALAPLRARLPERHLGWRFADATTLVLPLEPPAAGALWLELAPPAPRLTLAIDAADARVSPFTPFQAQLRARAVGALEGADQAALDRRCTLRFGAGAGFVPSAPVWLEVELTGRHANAILREEGGRILGVLREVGPELNRHRQLRPGLSYRPPPPYHKIDPRDATVEALSAALRGCPLARAHTRVDGVGRELTAAWAQAAQLDPQQPLEDAALVHAGEIQSPLLTNAGLAAGDSVRAALLLIDSLLTGAANPFTVLPVPSGDTTGVTDTAALNAVWADGNTKEWLIIPPEATAAAPYYINANVTNGGTTGFKLLAAFPRQAFHLVDNTTGTPHTPGTPWEIRDLVQIDGVGMGTGVRPVRFSGVTMEIVNSMISIDAYNLFGDGVGYIRESEIRIADHTARIAAAAADISLFENDILFTGAANNGQQVLTMSGAAGTNIRVANNKISGTLGAAALLFDLTAGIATSLTLLGPNIYRDTAAVSTYTPYSTVGNVGGITASPQAVV